MSCASSGGRWSSRYSASSGCSRGAVIVRVFDDALADFEGQIQSAERGVALLEIFDDAQGVEIVIEATSRGARMAASSAFSPAWPKGGWPMSWTSARASVRSTLSPSARGDGAGDLRDFDGMGEPVAEVIGVAAGEDLGLGFQAAKSAGMDHAVAVALKVVAVGMLAARGNGVRGIVPRAPRNRRAWRV